MPLGLQSGDILITNQGTLHVTNVCAKDGSDVRSNIIASRHHATPEVPRYTDFPTSFLPPRVYDAKIT